MSKLYHATYEPLLKKIKDKGLGNTRITFWPDSVPGVVYLSEDSDVAESYAETAEEIPEDWIDKIVILEIDSDDLDLDKLYIDNNNLNWDTLEYHGIIPWTKIKIFR
jgi:hypothetical protein